MSGSAVTVDTAWAARLEYVNKALEWSGAGNGIEMVAQFAVELRACVACMRAADGGESPAPARIVLHLNPRAAARPLLLGSPSARFSFTDDLASGQRRTGIPDPGPLPALSNCV